MDCSSVGMERLYVRLATRGNYRQDLYLLHCCSRLRCRGLSCVAAGSHNTSSLSVLGWFLDPIGIQRCLDNHPTGRVAITTVNYLSPSEPPMLSFACLMESSLSIVPHSSGESLLHWPSLTRKETHRGTKCPTQVWLEG